ncbi:extracellular serine/threonine protein kinase FAM20C-like [Physella acuta]|uniref:extracellular serine/threonine protein kinase FAM20C-like n=1 Tax=Physella acuta TaxID=109671 RepID=UPI0027DE5AF0|nr:extracellular serine/threonine protein kinase FAM20C-like [Physella acuta]
MMVNCRICYGQVLCIFGCVFISLQWYINQTSVLRWDAKHDTVNTVHQHVLYQPARGSRANHTHDNAEKLVQTFYNKYKPTNSIFYLEDSEAYLTFINRLKLNRTKGTPLTKFVNITGNTTWERFHGGIHQHYLYDPDDGSMLDDLLRDLNKRTILRTKSAPSTSHLALTLTFDNGGKGMFKAMRFPREQETSPNTFFFNDFERPMAEIAAFHLDKALAFYRVPPTVGRLVNITRDIIELADREITKTAHISPAGNHCFFGNCSQYCTQEHSICGDPFLLESSVTAYLPDRGFQKSSNQKENRYQQKYSLWNFKFKAEWEINENYCNVVIRRKWVTSHGLLNMIDMSIFDFLQGNLDRHNYEQFEMFGDDTFFVLYDNGRGFGKSKQDYLSILASLRQCCKIRLSTLAKLVKLYTGPDSLSQLLRTSLSSDPLAPVLTEPHLDALDRRVGLVISTVYDCVNRTGSWDQVIVDDNVI